MLEYYRIYVYNIFFMWNIEFWWNNELIKLVNKTGVSESMNYKNNIEQTKQNIEILQFLDELWIEENKQDKYLKEIVEYNCFNQVIDSFDEKDLNDFIQKFKKNNEKEIINNKKAIYALKKDWEEFKTNEKESKTNEKESKTNDISQNNKNIENTDKKLNLYKTKIDEIIKLKNLFGWEEFVYKYPKIIKLFNSINIDNFNESDSNTFDKVINILKNPATLATIASDLGWKWSEKYEEFKKAIISIDNSFRGRFDGIEWGKIELRAEITLGIDSLNWVDLTKDVLTKKTDDWFVIEAWKNWRFLSLQNSDYKINAGIDNLDEKIRFDEIEKNTKEKLNPINEELNSISKILKYVDQSIIQWKKIEEVKDDIKRLDLDLYNELNIDSADSLQSIKSILILAYKNKEDKKEEIINKQKELFENLVNQNKREALEKDEKRKEVLKFVNTIGLDTIPQSVIQPILGMVSWWNPIHIWNDIITWIDLSNFSFEWTFSPSLWEWWIDDLNSKKVFMKLSNKMMTWDENYPINIDSYTLWSKPSFRWKKEWEENSYEEISDVDLQTRIKSSLGSMPDSVIKQNLWWLDR